MLNRATFIAILAASTFPASAQTALETASFIIFGSLADKTDGARYWEDKKKGLIKRAEIEQENQCKYKVTGWEFYKNVNAYIEYTVDFSAMRDDPQVVTKTEVVSTFGPPSTLTHYLIPGVVICTKKRFPNTVLHDHPADGTCLNLFATRGFYDRTEANRQLGAIRYMKAAFCKGQAF